MVPDHRAELREAAGLGIDQCPDRCEVGTPRRPDVCRPEPVDCSVNAAVAVNLHCVDELAVLLKTYSCPLATRAISPVSRQLYITGPARLSGRFAANPSR